MSCDTNRVPYLGKQEKTGIMAHFVCDSLSDRENRNCDTLISVRYFNKDEKKQDL